MQGRGLLLELLQRGDILLGRLDSLGEQGGICGCSLRCWLAPDDRRLLLSGAHIVCSAESDGHGGLPGLHFCPQFFCRGVPAVESYAAAGRSKLGERTR